MNRNKSAVRHLSAIGIVLALLCGPPALLAQDMSTYYTVMHPEEFEIDWTGFYRTMNQKTAEVRESLPHALDLAYGTDPKQKLDVYMPGDATGDPAPVFLFLHGGGFREGDRAHYGAVAAPFAKHGFITAVASYRLTDDGFHYPDQPNDVQAAIEWLYENIAEYGGDPGALYVGGHSAGGILTADVGGNRAWMDERGVPRTALKGIVPISAPYDMRQRGREGEQNAYAPTAELQAAASPILHVDDPAPVAIVAVGTAEPYQQSSKELVEKLQAAGAEVTYVLLDSMDHKDTALALADEESDLFNAIVAMMSH